MTPLPRPSHTLLLCCALFAAAPGWAQIEEEQKLTPSDATRDDWFGSSVSVSGNVALVGAPEVDYLIPSYVNGSAYVFRRVGNQWVEEQKLIASDGGGGDFFGYAVSLDNDVALVGAYGDDGNASNSGTAYVFRYDGSTWVEEEKLVASDGGSSDYFGLSVSLDGDVALIGAFEGMYSHAPGRAYIFRKVGDQWVEEQKLVAPDAAPSDFFGYSVSLSGEVALVGAWGDEDNGWWSGSVYTFRWDGEQWVDGPKLTASDGTAGDRFGRAVSVNGDVALVGAPYDSDVGLTNGSAYVYRYDGSTWVEEKKLVLADASEYFGRSVAVGDGTLIVGATGDDDEGVGSGNAYVYFWDGTEWGQEHRLVASDNDEWDLFGWSAAVDGNVAAVGATWDEENGYKSGSAYVFTLPTVLAPTAGDVWHACQRHQVVWEAPHLEESDHVRVSLLRDGTETFILAYAARNDGGFMFDLPCDFPSGGDYRIRISNEATGLRVTGRLFTITAQPVDVEEESSPLREVVLRPVYPNPLGIAGVVRYGLPAATEVRLEVFDVLGRRVAVLAEGARPAGWHEAALSTERLAPGAYVVRLVAGERVRTRRITVVR